MSKRSQQLKKQSDTDKLIQQGAVLFLNMDSSLLHRLQIFSEELEIPLWMVIQNTLISDWARKAARIEVEGPDQYRLLPEFITDILDDGTEEPRTGEYLFNTLVQTYKRELKHLRNKKQKEVSEAMQKQQEELIEKYQ